MSAQDMDSSTTSEETWSSFLKIALHSCTRLGHRSLEASKLDALPSTVWHLHDSHQEFSIGIGHAFESITVRSLKAES